MLAVGFLWHSHSASALTLVPPSLEFSAQPGETIDTKIKLFNEESDAISVFSSTSNFTAKDESGDPNFDFADTPTDLASWIDVGVGPFTLQPGDRLEIPFSIKVPADAEPGGHYASVFFGTDPSIKPEGGGQVNIRSLIGTLVILRVAGDVREQAAVASFGPATKTLNRLPSTLELRIQNTGNVHVRPQGTVVIKNLFGGESARIPINEVNGAVLPASIRKFDIQWAKHDTTGTRGNFFQELGSEWSNFALGPYTATASITYGQSNLTLSSSTKFTVIPWRLLTVIVVVLGLLLWLLIFGIRRYNSAIIHRAQSHLPPPGTGK